MSPTSVNTTGDAEVIVRSILGLAGSLGLEVIAEGIERRDQLHRLREPGCDYGQGFFISRPLAANEIEAFLDSWAEDGLVGSADPVTPDQSQAGCAPVRHP